MARRRSVAFLGVASLMLAGCDPQPKPPASQQAPSDLPTRASALEPVEPRRVSFTDVAAQAGVTLRNVTGNERKRYLVETTGSGGCFLDFDLDGDLDLYLVNGATLETWRGPNPVRNALYRNDGDGTFTDVTEDAGVGDTGWGGGCAVADYDNDGDPDIFVTNFGRNVLYRNESDGTFTERADAAGIADDRWGAGAAFADVDRDGDLDLYVANYANFDADDLDANPSGCHWKGAAVMCGPRGFTEQADVLYHNQSDGTFRPVPAAADGFARFGLGVIAGDLDADGDPDLYVANDSEENLLFVNRGDGSFEERGVVAGVALSGDGRRQAGMGVDLGDYDGDGDEDIFVTNFSDDYHTLYRNDGGGLFTDASLAAGLAPTRPSLGWGGGFFDYDNDGDLDLFVAGGHVYLEVDASDPTTSYRQRNLLFRNEGSGRFRDVSAESGPGLLLEQPSRGVAFGDYDDDGDLDLIVVNENAVPALLRNDGGNARHWIKIRLVGSRSNRDGIGARVRCETQGLAQVRELRRNAGYYSSHDPRLHFGLGDAEQVERLEIVWPSGKRQVLRDLPADHLVTVDEHRGVLAVVALGGHADSDLRNPEAPPPEALATRREAVPRAAGGEAPIDATRLREVETFVVRGTDAILAGRYEDAVSAYAQALAHMPSWQHAEASPDALGFGDPGRYRRFLSGVYDNLGVALMRGERLDDCAEAIRLAIEIWPERAKYHHNLGLCNFHARRYADAVDALETARALDPRRPTLFYDLGRALVMAGRCDDAERELELATGTLPEPDLRGRRAEGWYYLGGCRAEAGRYPEAASAYRETLALVPGHQKALYKLGQALQRDEQTDAAEATLALFAARQAAEETVRATKLARSGGWPRRLALARSYLDARQAHAAIRELQTALAERPDDAQALTLLGEATLALHPPRLDMAEKAYGRILAQSPAHADALAGLGTVRVRQHHWADAEDFFRRAIASDARHGAARVGLARTASARGREREAMAALRNMLAEAPDDWSALLALAEIHANAEAGDVRDPEETLRLLDRASDRYGEAIETRVRAHVGLGQLTEARRLLRESPFVGARRRGVLESLADEG